MEYIEPTEHDLLNRETYWQICGDCGKFHSVLRACDRDDLVTRLRSKERWIQSALKIALSPPEEREDKQYLDDVKRMINDPFYEPHHPWLKHTRETIG